MEYLDFDLEIRSGAGLEYPVAVIRSPAGEARETMRFPFDKLVLENRLQALEIALLRSGGTRRQALSPEERTVQEFGQALFKALMGGEIRSRFDLSLQQARQQGKGLRLKLRLQAPELAALPWEFLFDERRGEYLCLSKNTPTIRYLELPEPPPSLSVTPPLRILGMIASPKDLPRLDVERERLRIEKAVQGLQVKGFLELTWLSGQTWRDLDKAMWGGPWHVFHFIGHGGFDRSSDEGLLALADDQGKKHFLAATQVARLLADHQSLRLVLLNSCEGARGGNVDIYSSTAAILVRRGIAAVLAMQYEITDTAAVEFSRVFYEALAYGMPIDAAVTAARVAVNIEVNNSLEWGTPVLYMRSPDGVLFELPVRQPELVIAETVAEPPPPELEAPEIKPCRLWVTVKPPGATVNFFNLRADFIQGMELAAGSYHLEITAAGWAPKREWIELKAGEDKDLKIALTRIEEPPMAPEPGTAPTQAPPTEALKPPPQTEAPKEFTNSLGMKFVLIPAGTFQMGSPEGEEGRDEGEKQHQVTLSRDFYLQTTPVTQGQWQHVMGNNPAHFKDGGDTCPVESVSWDDTREFIAKLNQREKTETYRLPTEAEWEYACRAGSTTRYCFGDDKSELRAYAWYAEGSIAGGIIRSLSKAIFGGGTRPVGRLRPNAWGLCDMHGHVWEWCQDWYGVYPAGPVTDPHGPGTGKHRVLRGGSWINNPRYLRSAGRLNNDPDFRYNYIGFRVARTL